MPPPRQHWLELRVPPPLVAGACALIGWSLARGLPFGALVVPGRIALAAALAAVGFALALSGVLAFRRARTTIHPLSPQASTQLVTSGVYARTRNPMYLGMALVLLAWSLWIAHAAGFAVTLLFVAFVTRFQIVPEERVLGERFGAAYAEYRRRVRRWI